MTIDPLPAPTAAGGRTRAKGCLVLSAGLLAAFVAVVLLLLFLASSLLHVTSSNAALYLLRHEDGSTELTTHLRPEETQRVERVLDLSYFFNWFARTRADIGIGNLELTWNINDGDGVIKEYRRDGTEMIIVISRFSTDAGTAHGLFIGGDLPLGDTQRIADASNNNTGMAYYDGKRWNHIWCSLNEGVRIAGFAGTVGPERWRFLDTTVRKANETEIMLESRHELMTRNGNGRTVHLTMTRTLQKRLDEDYVLLNIRLENRGAAPLSYSYEVGDEPWVGDFYRGSKGNVGWTDNELYKYEGYVRPDRHTFAGYWDIGNDVIGEHAEFTGYADFIEWPGRRPNIVYFANRFGYKTVDPRRPLGSRTDRVISLVWQNQVLKPGEGREYLVALGMARPMGGYPVKPDIRKSME